VCVCGGGVVVVGTIPGGGGVAPWGEEGIVRGICAALLSWQESSHIIPCSCLQQRLATHRAGCWWEPCQALPGGAAAATANLRVLQEMPCSAVQMWVLRVCCSCAVRLGAA
jgi:hypothetical protein